MPEIINPFTNVQQILPTPDPGTRYGSSFDRDVRELQVGFGSQVFRSNREGIWLGGATFASAVFKVSMAGALTATSATITGTITATSGSIGGWTIGSTTLTGGSVTLNSNGTISLGTGLTLSGSGTGTITGGTIQTAASGQRVVLDSDNTVKFYESGGVLAGQIKGFVDGVEGLLLFSAGAPPCEVFLSESYFSVNNGGFVLECVSNILQSQDDGNADLGSATNQWRDIYLVNAPTVSSDIRFKKDVKPLSYGLSEINRINPISFSRSGKHLGFSAQELQKILPEIVKGKNKLGIVPDEIIPVLVNAVKELSKEVELLKVKKK